MAVAAPPALSLGQPPSVLQVDADRLSFQQGERTLVLQGHVLVKGASLAIRAQRVVLRLDTDGSPRAVDAVGGVRVQMGPSSASARRLSLVLGKTRTLQLTQGATLRLERPRLTVAGERIRVDLVSGHLTVDRARVSLGRPAAGGPTDG